MKFKFEKLPEEELNRRRREWEEQSDKRMKLFEQMMSARSDQDMTLYDKLFLDLQDMEPSYCEHERSWTSNCWACDEIYKQMFPENCQACSTCGDLMYAEELQDGDCDDCFMKNIKMNNEY